MLTPPKYFGQKIICFNPITFNHYCELCSKFMPNGWTHHTKYCIEFRKYKIIKPETYKFMKKRRRYLRKLQIKKIIEEYRTSLKDESYQSSFLK